jgi:hypothetical protein
VSDAGAALFARYAYPPNELGYCGPEDASVLLRRGSPAAAAQIADHARQFEGAWSYLELIAQVAGIEDPLDARVVEAYWIGNDLLDAVDPEHAMGWLQDRFGAQPQASWVPGLPHHGFQVFAVYPWASLLHRSPNTAVALNVLEQCRIRWGEVLGVEGSRVQVRSRPLVFVDGRLDLGDPVETSAAWAVDGKSLLAAPDVDGATTAPVAVGDRVAMHWDWLCDVLTADQVKQLELRSADQLARTNAGLQTAGA